MEEPGCACEVTAEPRHLIMCPRTWALSREVKRIHQIGIEEDLYRFVLGKGAGVRKWFLKFLGL